MGKFLKENNQVDSIHDKKLDRPPVEISRKIKIYFIIRLTNNNLIVFLIYRKAGFKYNERKKLVHLIRIWRNLNFKFFI